jgi:hypothetical protein
MGRKKLPENKKKGRRISFRLSDVQADFIEGAGESISKFCRAAIEKEIKAAKRRNATLNQET